MQCLNCHKECSNPKFCNASCAAIYNNKNRKLSLDSKTKISNSLSKDFDINQLKILLEDKKSVSHISKVMNISETTIRKKIKDNNLEIYKKPITCKKVVERHFYSELSHCPEHNIEFKIGKTGKKYCKDCNNNAVTKVRMNRKIECVLYKGGKCERCGYNKCLSALEFHHIDPNEKDFSISTSDRTSFDFLKPELDKCMLLCSNCHREIHEEIKNNGNVINWKIFVDKNFN